MAGPLPLLGLRAFAEIGRAGSMKAAAHRLGVTPGAVSQQIRSLETRLGVALFERRNREVRLTRFGESLLADLADAFGRIEDALGRIERDRARHRPGLVVSTTGAFAATWLVPRLGRFTALHPRIAVQIQTTPDLVPVGAGPGSADVAIRHGLGDWPGLDAVRLLQPRLIPVGSAGLLAKGPPIHAPADCLRYPLLHDPDATDWRLWLRALGADHDDPRLAHGTRFSDSTLLVRAAVAGQGLALVRDTYVAEEIMVGRLKIAFDAPWPARFAYYVVTRRGARGRSPQIACFREWLLQEAASEG